MASDERISAFSPVTQPQRREEARPVDESIADRMLNFIYRTVASAQQAVENLIKNASPITTSERRRVVVLHNTREASKDYSCEKKEKEMEELRTKLDKKVYSSVISRFMIAPFQRDMERLSIRLARCNSQIIQAQHLQAQIEEHLEQDDLTNEQKESLETIKRRTETKLTLLIHSRTSLISTIRSFQRINNSFQRKRDLLIREITSLKRQISRLEPSF